MSNSNHSHSSAISSNIKINMGLQSKKHFKAEIFFCQGTWGITVNSYTCLWKRPEIWSLEHILGGVGGGDKSQERWDLLCSHSTHSKFQDKGSHFMGDKKEFKNFILGEMCHNSRIKKQITYYSESHSINSVMFGGN